MQSPGKWIYLKQLTSTIVSEVQLKDSALLRSVILMKKCREGLTPINTFHSWYLANALIPKEYTYPTHPTDWGLSNFDSVELDQICLINAEYNYTLHLNNADNRPFSNHFLTLNWRGMLNWANCLVSISYSQGNLPFSMLTKMYELLWILEEVWWPRQHALTQYL